ncbi:MAG: ComEC/Rec2 family competence protein, partial [Bythopirellula sp.]
MSASQSPRPELPTPRRPLLQLAIAAAIGIVLDRWSGSWLFESGPLFWWLGATGCLLSILLLHRYRDHYWGAVLLLTAAACIAGSWHHLRWHYYEQDHLARFAAEVPQPVCLQAVALDRLKWSPAPPKNLLRALPVGPRSELQVRVTRVRDGREWREVSGDCKLRVNGELHHVMAGDELQIFALMMKKRPALNPGEYDWSEVARGGGQHCELFCRSPECVTVSNAASGWDVRRWLHQLGQRYERRLTTYVRPGQRDLALAILLGARERLQPDDRAAFLQTGTIHLLVVSGLHVGLLALAIWAIVCSGLLPRQMGLVLTGCLVVGYALVAGGRPPVMRASVLVVLTLASYACGRRVSPANILAAAALVVLAINPTELFRSGTQLSFLCVAALAAYGTVFQREKKVDPLNRLVRETRPSWQKFLRWIVANSWHTAAASLAVWLVVAPLVAYHFHITAPIAILITPVLWPLVAIALISGLAICFVGWVLPPIAWLLGEICSFCLWSTKAIVTAAQQIELGNAYLPGPPGWWIFVFYVGLLLALVYWARARWTWHVSLAALWIAVGLAAASWKSADEQLQCHFLAVGHGTCVVLELPGGETMLYDAGSLGSPEYAAQTIASFLWSRGITRLDAIVLSHADVDHYNALPDLLERFAVTTVYVSPLMFDPWISDGELDAPNLLKATIEAAGIPWQEIWVDDRLRTSSDQVTIEVLHPPRTGVAGRDNANSLLLAVRYAGQSILLPGDL